MVSFSVANQGPGIPRAWTKRVFNRFVQVEARHAGHSVGSGLGLVFCRLAIEAHGGRIWMESDVDKGTMVTFTLPKAEPRVSTKTF
jgi:signal transduction histidine kinase